MKAIKNLLERFSLTFALFGSIVIAYLSLVNLKGVKMPINFKFIDKVEHFIAYLLLSFFWFLAIQNRPKIRISNKIMFFLVVMFGLCLEFLQANMTEYRSGEVYDFIANTIGVIFGYFVFKIWNSY